MKITRSSKTSLKCATKKKQQVLANIFNEYACVVNKFIDYFWDHPEVVSKAQLTASYYLHKVVKDYFETHDLRLVVVEKLQDLKQGKKKRHKAFRKTLSHWNYRELLEIIQLRCEKHRVSFRSVSPYKTNQSLS